MVNPPYVLSTSPFPVKKVLSKTRVMPEFEKERDKCTEAQEHHAVTGLSVEWLGTLPWPLLDGVSLPQPLICWLGPAVGQK